LTFTLGGHSTVYDYPTQERGPLRNFPRAAIRTYTNF
jgi:hypothetical protein